MNQKIKRIFVLLNMLMLSFISNAQLSEPLPFLTKSKPYSALITDYSDIQNVKAPCVLVRLPNQKLAYMVRQDNELKPFYIRAIETGYWDTRYVKDVDYDNVFADMKKMGANTAYIMLHWEDLEIADNVFDFSFPDQLVHIAKRHDLKIGWVLFLHAQSGYVPSLTPETAWTFHLDDRDSSNYTMQWVKRKGNLYTTIKDVLDYGIRPLHVYGHKEIFYRIRRMLYNLAVHYKDDDTVIQVQLGNEEGFSFLDESDYNPITAELYDEWKLKTNKTDYAQFKKEAIDWWWQQFTSAYHEGDPYKILSFNLDAGQAEAGDEKRVRDTGTSASTYADGNLDAIGTMFYKEWGEKAFLGIDRRYSDSYQYKLPILIPSEIGIGQFNPSLNFRHFVLQSLERAAQGLGVYCYGEVSVNDSKNIAARNDLIWMFDCVKENEDIIYEGLPGPGFVKCLTPNHGYKISHLNRNGAETIAMIYRSDIKDSDSISLDLVQVEIQDLSKDPKIYHIEVRKSDDLVKKDYSFSNQMEKAKTITIPAVKQEDVIFVSIREQP